MRLHKHLTNMPASKPQCCIRARKDHSRDFFSQYINQYFDIKFIWVSVKYSLIDKRINIWVFSLNRRGRGWGAETGTYKSWKLMYFIPTNVMYLISGTVVNFSVNSFLFVINPFQDTQSQTFQSNVRIIYVIERQTYR